MGQFYTTNNSFSGGLYIVATPIGNLYDITLRALDILSRADVIYCEDTRVAKILLAKYDINYKKLVVHNEFSTREDVQCIVDFLLAGDKIAALISDAGTPLISDPGNLLCKELICSNISIFPVPGPSAIISALVVAGITPMPFTFRGFFPRKMQEGKDILNKIQEETNIFFESPHRIHRTMALIAECAPDAEVCLAREMTKIYEEFLRGTAREVSMQLQNQPKGEFVLIIKLKPTEVEVVLDIQQQQAIKLLRTIFTTKDTVKVINALAKLDNQVLYKIAAHEGKLK